ncbi:hypothetical protein IMZ48_47300 [Candidatus Bathyarchaeota archaeon]|nr:hypothetical protein [Candidatus Bathyarchaeota archaeon]
MWKCPAILVPRCFPLSNVFIAKPVMENKDKSPVGSPVGSPKSPVASPELPVGSPKSPIASPKSPIASPKSPLAEAAPAPPTSGLLPENYWTDAPQTDDDDGLEDNASSTASISSSVLQYRTINGRTYHSTRGNAEYW